MSLSNNFIEHFSIDQSSNLSFLDLSFNPLLKNVSLTNELVCVNLNGNRMMKLIQPKNDLRNLKYLYLSQVRNNLIESINFNSMPNLLELDLSSNQVIDLSNLEQYNNRKLKSILLRNINISFNTSLFVRFPNLEVLDVGGCKQMNFVQNDNRISDLINLKKLSLNNLNMNFDLKFIANLVYLEYLDVSNNQIETIYIPNRFERLQTEKMKYLNLSYNKLREFHPSYLFAKSQNFFEVLDLSFNSISSMTQEILYKAKKTIKVIKANNNNFTQNNIVNLLHDKPETVDLSCNRLNSFPKESHYQVHMKYLKLNDNIFEFITDEIFRYSYGSYASELVLLDLSRNKIRNISETSLLDLVYLKYLKLGRKSFGEN